jgi:hypothetical protein
MMGGGGNAHPENVSDIENAQLSSEPKCMENLEAVLVGNGGKNDAGIFQLLLGRHLRP